MTIPFEEFPKIARLNREVIVTEKIDGTNAQIHIRAVDDKMEFGVDTQVEFDGIPCYLRAGSRTRWLTHGGTGDNFGFGQWVYNHAHELVKLGPGAHYGEWWGQGIQRKYGLTEKRFSLFNRARWHTNDSSIIEGSVLAPRCCHVVPVLGFGVGFDMTIAIALDHLRRVGSSAAPGFMQPEGIVAFHTHSRQLFKVTLEKDEEHKSQQKVAA